jgi:hypothetical protein
MTSEDAKKAILKLFQCYNTTGEDTDKAIKFTAYWDVLRDLPPDAIIDVCRKASRGEIGNPAFLPTAGELYRAAGIQNNSARRYPVLNEPHRVISKEERARVIQGFKDLKAELAATKSQPTVEGWTTLGQAVQLREWTSEMDKPLPKLSPELRKILGCGIPEISE